MHFSLQKTVFILIGILCFLFTPFAFATAADNLDARCFSKAECTRARKEFNIGSSEAAKGFYNKTAETNSVCQNRTDSEGVELGFCLPAGEAVTGVKFGNTNKFSNIGDFISYMYRYGVIFAGLLAVIMIIIGGFQWTASAGNSSNIESAKKRIAGAITGLILVVTSYTILNAINPSTVNLRLPQVWLLRNIDEKIEFKYCMELPLKLDKNANFAIPKVGEYTEADQKSGNFTKVKADKDAYSLLSPLSKDPTLARVQAIYPDKKETENTRCGKTYVVADTEGSTCLGTYCDAHSVCMEEKNNTCVKFEIPGGGIGGSIEHRNGKYMNKIDLRVICLNDDSTWSDKFLQQYKLKENSTYYQFQDVPNTAAIECKGADKVMGYFFVVYVNDSDAAPTIDDEWFGGKSFCRNMSSNNSCGFYGTNNLDEESINPTILMSLAQINEIFTFDPVKPVIRCDFFNTETSMPNLGNGFIKHALVTEGVKILTALGVNKYTAEQAGAAQLTPDSESFDKDFCPHFRSKENAFKDILKRLSNR